MKFMFLAGGLTGFLIATAAGLSAGRSPDSVLLSAAVSAVAGAILFRWFWTVFLVGIRDSYLARLRAAEQLAADTRKKT